LRRANSRDVDPRNGGFGQVAWLMAHATGDAAALVDPFLAKVCNDTWLQIAYTSTSCGGLAAGLRRLALHQTVARCQRFHHRRLGARLKRELAAFGTVGPADQSQIIQLVGSAALCGWAISQRSLAAVWPSAVARLPVDVLPHRHD